MGEIDLLAVVLGAAALFGVGMAWYGVLFAGAWTKAMSRGRRDFTGDKPVWVVFAITFAFALLIALTLAHQYAMTSPGPRAMMMIAIGYGLMLIVPALGIRYLYLGVPGRVFAIDAGYFVVGMAAMGAVFVALR